MIEERVGPSFTVTDATDTLTQARDALAEGSTDEAFALYRSLLATDGPQRIDKSSELDALLGLGVCHARRQEWAEALIALNELCERAPHFAPARAYRGAALFELGEIDDARADLDAAVADKPHDAVARLKRAEVCLSLGLLDDAEDDLRVAARVNGPDDLTRQYARDLLTTVLRRKQRAVTRTTASPVDALRGLARFARELTGRVAHD